MKYVRIFAGPDGESHFEDLEMDLRDVGRASLLSQLFEATGVVFRHTGADYSLDWHTAPRRQFVLNLTGGVEIQASDGEVRRLGPGSVFLAEDTTGKGHLSRAIDGQERVSVFVHLA